MYRLSLFVSMVLIAVCRPVWAASSDPNEYGLRFVSHEDIKDNRTGLLLTPRGGMRLGDEFTLSFEVKFRPAVHTFGYVFRLVADDVANLDMVSDIEGDPAQFEFVVGQRTVSAMPLGNGRVFDRWIPVSVNLAPGRGELTVTVDGQTRTVPVEFHGERCAIWFGACDHPAFYNTDVPPMSLRDVSIARGPGKTPRHWSLDRHDGDNAIDQTGKYPATARNPVWMLDRYNVWQKRISTVVPEEYLAMAADPGTGTVYFAAGNHLAVYDNASASLDIKTTTGPMPFRMMPNQIVYDPSRGLVVAYEIESQQTATLSPAGLEWSPATEANPIPRYWQHNAAYIPGTGLIVTFGGYGEHTYKSRVNVISPDGGWTTIDPAPGLPPRYLSGMAVMPDGGVIVAGGYGNASGLQSEFPHNFYDIRRLDPLTGRADSLVSIVREKGDEHFVPGRDMVPSDDGKTLYVLVYSDKHYASSLQLAGIDLATGRMVRYADEVPYQFSDIESFCTLAFDRVRQEFLMVTMRQQKGEGTLVEIFSLGAPPLCGTDTIRAAGGESAWWWIVLGAAAVAGVAGAVFALARRRRPAMPVPVTAYKAVHEVRDENKSYTTEKRPSSILLLGGFQVVDRAGDDITGQFTQTLRALLLLILLETCKSGRGISSQALGDILWLDKDPENARNNRNVNIHKLRTLLAKVGTAHVSSKSSYWKLELGPDVFCDYAALLATGRELQRRKGDPEVIESLVALASLGKLLPCTQTEWSDGYKADFSARLIEQLMEAASRPEVEANPALSLRIADAILTHDSLDEDAMRLKCGALVKMGKKNQAKQEYNLFVAEFKKALDTAPDFNFSDTL